MPLIRQSPDTITISDEDGPISVTIEETPIEIEISEDKVFVTVEGDDQVEVLISEEETTVITVFEIANPPTGPASGDLIEYYPAPRLRPTGITPGRVDYPQYIIFGADGRATAAQAGSVPAGSDKNYTHEQTAPSDTWTVNHNLGKKPSVSVTDSAGTTVIGKVVYTSLNQVILYFSAPFSGTAILN